VNPLPLPFAGLSLLEPWLLLAALAVPATLILRRRRRPPALPFAPAALLGGEGPPPPRSWRVRLRALPAVLEALGLLLAAAVLARPAEAVAVPEERRGIDVLLCLDTSSSMRAPDLDGRRTRLEVAKEAAAAFVRGRPGDRIGLVTFARYPDLRCPPTLDHRALAEVLGRTAPVEADGPEDATGIGLAVARAAGALRGGGARSRVVVLLTDGEENVATTEGEGSVAPSHAAQLAERLGVRVHAILAGAGGADGAGGRPPIDTGPVERMAARTGGRFFEARDAGALRGVYAEIDALERSRFEAPRTEYEDRALPFLAAALVLLAAGRVLGRTALEVLP
jgi:Ca-activated chloride channel family protein